MREVLPLLLLKGVSRHFFVDSSATMVLDNIDLTIQAGEMVAIMGASGSGKSTLMNIIGCLDRPTSGQYLVAGEDVAHMSSDELARLRRERFGFVFQRYHLISSLSVLHNVEVPAGYAHRPRSERRGRAEHLLTLLRMEAFGQRRVNHLSGGQQQRVSIARALMNGGEIILADEPTGALDSHNGQEVMKLLQSLHRQGHTVILITHDAMVASYAPRVIYLRDGRIKDRQGEAISQVNVPSDEALGEQPRCFASASSSSSSVQSRWWQIRDVLLSACRTMGAHRLRTGLTLLGIVIGILSVVLLNAAGQGARQYVLENFNVLGGNLITLYPGKSRGDDHAAGIRSLLPRDLDALAALPWVKHVSPGITGTTRVRWQQTDSNVTVNGASSGVLEIKSLKLLEGRGFLSRDIERETQVVLIDENLKKKLFSASANVLGQVILVGTLPCEVIGVVKSQAVFVGSGLNLWIPWSTTNSRLLGQNWFNSLSLIIDNRIPSADAERIITNLLTRIHGQQDFFLQNSENFVSSIERVSSGLTLFLSLVASVALLVGGVGVMNIMLVSVTERTQETGIRMAVGARQRDIQWQFLTEAVLICVLGAVIGVLLSFVIGQALGLFSLPWRLVFSGQTLWLAIGCAVVVGCLSGWFPARQASRLDPAQALTRD
ncbi:MacB family efflux pump subunit [Pseudomonas fluorescens]|uniref:MacB family efflux pump subunit n=1 Tax=Pseudomonas fluorescens TaxID=294 RepID=UPI001BE799D9|nr:MacB family efflux pump subunit [Pseudomonas fluorescens]MBT2373904.1 MacB family efflux pump subunit [Pseudomonas fluorescens]